MNQATATVFSGQAVDLAETLGAGNTGTYTSQIVCDPAAGLQPDGDGRGGTYQVPGTPVPVTCTITNTRTSAALILQKTWVNGAVGDAAGLAIAVPAPGAPAAAVSTASGATGSETDTAHQATATVFSGQTIALAEVLAADNTGTYTSQIVCDQPGLTPMDDGRGGTYEVPAAPVAVTCTVTNTRTSASLILQKEWVNGAAGDTDAAVDRRRRAGHLRGEHVDRDRRRRVGNGRRSPGHRNRVLRADARPGRDIRRRQHRHLCAWTSPAPTRIGVPRTGTRSPAPTRSPPTPLT